MKFRGFKYYKTGKMSLFWLVLPVSIAVVFIAGHVGVTRSSFLDSETAADSAFQVRTSTLWTQTTQGEFALGISSQVDIASSPGNVVLSQYEPSKYFSSGNFSSQVLDTNMEGAVWNVLSWDETVDGNTNIIFLVRASDSSFLEDATEPTWVSVGDTSPVTSGLPEGKYLQWRATLTTSDNSTSPVLQEVRVYYY